MSQILKNIELYKELYGNEIYLNSFSNSKNDIISFNSLENYIFIESGNSNSKIVFIVNDLETNNNIDELSFPGESRKLLDKMFFSINLDEENFFLINTLEYKSLLNQDLKQYKIREYSSYLKNQLKIIKPNLIVALGKVSANKILHTDSSFNDMRNKIFDYKGIDFLVTYHPKALLRDENLKKFAWEDFKLIRDKYINV